MTPNQALQRTAASRSCFNRRASIPRWAIVLRRSSSTRWRQLFHPAPRPCSFFSHQRALNLNE